MPSKQHTTLFSVVIDIETTPPEEIVSYDLYDTGEQDTTCALELVHMFCVEWERREKIEGSSLRETGFVMIQGLARTPSMGFSHYILEEVRQHLASAIESIEAGEFIVPCRMDNPQHETKVEFAVAYCSEGFV